METLTAGKRNYFTLLKLLMPAWRGVLTLLKALINSHTLNSRRSQSFTTTPHSDNNQTYNTIINEYKFT